MANLCKQHSVQKQFPQKCTNAKLISFKSTFFLINWILKRLIIAKTLEQDLVFCVQRYPLEISYSCARQNTAYYSISEFISFFFQMYVEWSSIQSYTRLNGYKHKDTNYISLLRANFRIFNYFLIRFLQ